MGITGKIFLLVLLRLFCQMCIKWNITS